VSRPLTSLSGLDGLAVPGSYGVKTGGPGVIIAERSGLGLATVAARKGKSEALKAAAREAYGVALPERSLVARGSDILFIGTGPGQWLAVSERHANEDLARELAGRLQGLASVADQSGGRTVIRIGGPRARDVLAKGLPIDLDPRVLPSNGAATSVISLMGVQLWQADDMPAYDLAIFRSLSGSFWRWLASSAAEFGYEVKPG
jgi:methylglutamate dehydrogenase subunit D